MYVLQNMAQSALAFIFTLQAVICKVCKEAWAVTRAKKALSQFCLIHVTNGYLVKLANTSRQSIRSQLYISECRAHWDAICVDCQVRR